MVDEHRDMEGWGVYSIFKEAGRLLYQHIRILRPFILAFLLPLALILFLQVIGDAWLLTWIADHLKPHHFGESFDHHHHHHHFGFHAFHAAFSKAPNAPDPISILTFELLVFFLVYTFVFLISTISWLLVSLTTAAIGKAVHHIYSSSHNEDSNSSQSQALTLFHSIFTALPHCFYRIFVISLCFFVVDVLTYLLLALPFYFLSGPQFAPYHLQTIYVWLWNFVFTTLDFWFLVSVQVVVLESRYDGWAALQRSAKLVKVKAVTALGLLVVYFVYVSALKWVVLVAVVISAHSVTLYVVALALAVVYLAVAAFWLVVVTVFYFVSKRKWSAGGGAGEEEGRQAEARDQYQALDVMAEN